MISFDSLNEIRQWFNKNGKVEFDLPDDHFGRPGDSFDALDYINIEDNDLVIILNTIETFRSISDALRKFIFHGEILYRFIDDCLEIDNFDLLVFEWQEAEEPIYHTETYNYGTVRFIPNSKYAPLW
jgi:hypothetical protein